MYQLYQKISIFLFILSLLCLNIPKVLATESCVEQILQINKNPYYPLNEVAINDFETNKDILNLKIKDLNNKKQIIPFNVVASGVVEDVNTSETKLTGDFSGFNSLSASTDLNAWNRNLIEEVNSLEIKISESELAILESNEQELILNAFLDILSSKELGDIFEKKLHILQRVLEFYEVQSSLGRLDNKGMSDTEKVIQELQDKIFSNEIRYVEKINYLKIDSDSISQKPSLSTLNLKKTKEDCIYDFQSLNIAKFELEILKLEVSRFNFFNSLNIDSSLNFKQPAFASSVGTELSFSINITADIFDGGVKKTKLQDLLSKISAKNHAISRLEDKYLELENRRLQTERVFIKSVKTLENQLEDLSKTSRVRSRKSLGQSVFLELSNTTISYLNTVETVLRLKTDYLKGKAIFLKEVNGFGSYRNLISEHWFFLKL